MARVRQFPQYFAYMHGWYEDTNWIFLAMDYFELGDLSHHLQSTIPENEARDIVQQLLSGLVEMHNMGITHRDLKPTNIFVVARSTPSWDVRIGDFGIAKRVHENETALRTITGTRQYMAPELDPWLVDDEEAHVYTQAVDIWALGVLLFQMLTLKMVFRDPTSLRKYYKGRLEFPREPLLEANVTLACINFHEALLQPSPRDRPSSKDAISQEWMQMPINSANDAEADAHQQDGGIYSGTSSTITPTAIVRHESNPRRTTGSSSSKNRYVPRQEDHEAEDAVSATYTPTSSSGSVADGMKRSAGDMEKGASKPWRSRATSPKSQISSVPSNLSPYALSRRIGQPLDYDSPQPELASRSEAASNYQGPSHKSATQIAHEATVP